MNTVDINELPPIYQKQVIAKLKDDTSHTIDVTRAHKPVKQKSKYGNIKTTVDGITFDSKAEAERYYQLKYLHRGGEIAGFIRQVSIPLHVDRYIADFLVVEKDGTFYLEDVKGYETATFKKKKKEIKKLYPWLDFRVKYA